MASTPTSPGAEARAKSNCQKTKEEHLQTTYHTSGAPDRSWGLTQAGALAETSEAGREHPNLKAAAVASTGALVDKLTLKEHLGRHEDQSIWYEL